MKLPFFSKPEKTAPKQRIYLDYAAATPVHDSVYAAMVPYFSSNWANPSAIYKEGVLARAVIEEHRTELARKLNVRPEDVTFTSGGTEANNIALLGTVEHLHQVGRAYSEMEIITTRIEHPSVLEALAELERRGVVVRFIPLDEYGRVDAHAIGDLLNEKTVLVTIGYVNSEIGVVQDIKKISRAVRKWNDANKTEVYVHVDACQAPLWLPCMLDMLGVDMLSLDAGKCYGPKGVGVLVHRHWVTLKPTIYGGGQERGLRSGTENVPLIIGCVRALVRAQDGYVARSEATTALREYFFAELAKQIPEAVINGHHTERVANNVNISLPGVDTEYATIWLDAKGIAVSTKSACGAGKGAGSHVVREITKDEVRALSTLRFTLGEETTKEDINTAPSVLKDFLNSVCILK